jgi:tocopherol O-methyltransferase
MREKNNLSNKSALSAQFSVSTGVPDLPRICAYYDETWLDYRLLWLNPENYAIHFGYWDENTRSHVESLINMNRALASWVGIRPGQRILDAGCGVGGSSIWLAKEYGVEVVGITLPASQITRAWRYAQQHGVADHVSFAQADYTQTPFADGSFDVVWALESLCHAPDKAAFYQEAARLLRPDGRLVLAEYIRAARPLDTRGEHLLHAWLDGWAIPDLSTRAEHLSHAAAAGLMETVLDDITAHMRPSLRRLYRITFWTYPLAFLLHRLGLRSTTQHGNVLGALRQYQALEQGLWFYGLLVARKMA